MITNNSTPAVHAAAGVSLYMLLLIGGCSTSADPSKDYATVSGKVTVDNKPAKGAYVEFHVGDASQNATVGADGAYKISTLTPGTYQLAVKSKGAGSSRSKAGGEMKSTEPSNSSAIVIPRRYQDSHSSGFEVGVKPGESKSFDLEMKAH